MRGSVRALLSVRFSAVSAMRNELRSLVKMSIPPGSTERNSSSPVSTYKDARRFEPASVSTREPLGKSKAARLWRPASFHQVQHQPEIALNSNRDSLADSPQFAHDAAFHVRNRGVRGSKQKGAGNSCSLDRLRDDARFECSDVGGEDRKSTRLNSS